MIKNKKFIPAFLSITMFFTLTVLMAMGDAALAGLDSQPSSQAECKAFHDAIENDFKKANFCEKDTDCKVVQLGGWYIDFGCYKFVNVSTREDELLDRVHKYKDEMRCSGKINDCASFGTPTCVEKKCTAKPIY